MEGELYRIWRRGERQLTQRELIAASRHAARRAGWFALIAVSCAALACILGVAAILVGNR